MRQSGQRGERKNLAAQRSTTGTMEGDIMTITQLRHVLLAGAGLLSCPALAMAAEPADTARADSADSANVKEIIVTAFKRSETILKVPAAITAVQGDQLRTLTKYCNG